jgi:plasmid stability protein
MADVRVRNLPEAVRKALRQKALDEGISMNTLLIRLLTQAVRK